MIEEPRTLGADERMVGILTSPESPSRAAPTVLLLNAGLVHHVGPNRLNVDVARALANAGFRSLRFDQSGIGDSSLAASESSYEKQAVTDIVEVMDELGSDDGSRFVAMGLCTGAYNALNAMHEDPRLVGGVLIDGYAFPTFRYQVTHQLRRVSQWWRWKRYLKRMLSIGDSHEVTNPYESMVFQPVTLERADYEQRVSQILGRGARLQLVFTGHGPQPYNYESQFADAFPTLAGEGVEVSYFPDATHTFTRVDHRRDLIDEVVKWTSANFLRSSAGVE